MWSGTCSPRHTRFDGRMHAHTVPCSAVLHLGVTGAAVAGGAAALVGCGVQWGVLLLSGRVQGSHMLRPPPAAAVVPLLQRGAALSFKNFIGFGGSVVGWWSVHDMVLRAPPGYLAVPRLHLVAWSWHCGRLWCRTEGGPASTPPAPYLSVVPSCVLNPPL